MNHRQSLMCIGIQGSLYFPLVAYCRTFTVPFLEDTMKTIIIALCLLVAGCTSTVSQTEQQYYDVYDEQGKRKGYIRERDGHITIYDENWQRKGYLERK